MSNKKIYKCEICGNVVELVNDGGGQLVCCGQPMKLMDEQTADLETEKHVPFIERTDDGYIVRIGKNEKHPMETTHYIQWIELVADGVTYRKFLTPEDKPEVVFSIPKAEELFARAYCNLHGLWKSE